MNGCSKTKPAGVGGKLVGLKCIFSVGLASRQVSCFRWRIYDLYLITHMLCNLIFPLRWRCWNHIETLLVCLTTACWFFVPLPITISVIYKWPFGRSRWFCFPFWRKSTSILTFFRLDGEMGPTKQPQKTNVHASPSGTSFHFLRLSPPQTSTTEFPRSPTSKTSGFPRHDLHRVSPLHLVHHNVVLTIPLFRCKLLSTACS